MRYGRRDGAEADPQPDVEALGELDHGGAQFVPSEIRLGARQDEEVALVDPAMQEGQAGPRQLGDPAIDDLEGRSPRPIVEEDVAVERGDGRPAVGEVSGRNRRGPAGVDPAIERRDEDGAGQLAGFVEAVEAHRARIGRRLERGRYSPGAGRSVVVPGGPWAAGVTRSGR